MKEFEPKCEVFLRELAYYDSMLSRTIAPLLTILLALAACSSDSPVKDSPDAEAPTDAGVMDSATDAPMDAPTDAPLDAPTDAPSSMGKACLDTKSSGDGTPYTCDVLPSGLSEQDIMTVCGAFDIVDSCPTAGRTYRCNNAKSQVLPSVRTERFYYLVKKAAADKATKEDCDLREGDYSVL